MYLLKLNFSKEKLQWLGPRRTLNINIAIRDQQNKMKDFPPATKNFRSKCKTYKYRLAKINPRTLLLTDIEGI